MDFVARRLNLKISVLFAFLFVINFSGFAFGEAAKPYTSLVVKTQTPGLGEALVQATIIPENPQDAAEAEKILENLPEKSDTSVVVLSNESDAANLQASNKFFERLKRVKSKFKKFIRAPIKESKGAWAGLERQQKRNVGFALVKSAISGGVLLKPAIAGTVLLISYHNSPALFATLFGTFSFLYYAINYNETDNYIRGRISQAVEKGKADALERGESYEPSERYLSWLRFKNMVYNHGAGLLFSGAILTDLVPKLLGVLVGDFSLPDQFLTRYDLALVPHALSQLQLHNIFRFDFRSESGLVEWVIRIMFSLVANAGWELKKSEMRERAMNGLPIIITEEDAEQFNQYRHVAYALFGSLTLTNSNIGYIGLFSSGLLGFGALGWGDQVANFIKGRDLDFGKATKRGLQLLDDFHQNVGERTWVAIDRVNTGVVNLEDKTQRLLQTGAGICRNILGGDSK